jgi:uncharacterized protein (DUF2141 family)
VSGQREVRRDRTAAIARRWAVGLVLLVTGSIAGAAEASAVEVTVTGVTDSRGHIRVELCTRETFLKPDCPYKGVAPATLGATVVRIEAPPGVYAAQAYADVTDQGVVHQNFFGIPREKIGFSNDAPVHMRAPRFDVAAFTVGQDTCRITFRVRHLP